MAEPSPPPPTGLRVEGGRTFFTQSGTRTRQEEIRQAVAPKVQATVQASRQGFQIGRRVVRTARQVHRGPSEGEQVRRLQIQIEKQRRQAELDRLRREARRGFHFDIRPPPRARPRPKVALSEIERLRQENRRLRAEIRRLRA